MNRRGLRAALVTLLLFGVGLGCRRAPLPRAELDKVEHRGSASLVPIARSAARRPTWLQGEGAPLDGKFTFVGRGTAATESRARRAAIRDLFTNLSMFTSVQVRYEATDRTTDDDAGETFERVDVATATRWPDLSPDASYWERWSSPLSSAADRVEYFTRVQVSSERIARARAAARRRRTEAGGRPTLVVLPPTTTSSTTVDPIAGLMQAELTQRIRGARWSVPDADQVRGVLLAVPDVAALRLERVEEIFAADVALGSFVDSVGDRVAVTLVRHDLAAGTARTLARVEVPAARRHEVANAVMAQLAPHLELVSSAPADAFTAPLAPDLTSTAPAAAPADAFTARARAERAFAEGRNEEALDAITAAIRIAPTAGAHLRAGRILDRLGRYARPSAVSPRPGGTLASPEVCSEAGREAARRAQSELQELDARLRAPAQRGWWTSSTPTLEALLRPVIEQVDSWTECSADEVRCVDGCVAAGAPCPDVDLDPRLEDAWRRIYGVRVTVRPGAPVRPGPHASHAPFGDSEGGVQVVGRIGAMGHWMMVSGAPRGWIRASDLVPKPASTSIGPPSSAAEAYAAAFELARRAGDRRNQAEAALALATVALRAEALGPAWRLWSAVGGHAARTQDLDLQSRAAFGAGRALRAMGRRDEAKDSLQRALALRDTIGGQIERLEIHTELGGLAIERGDDPGAAHALSRAWWLARQLGNAYLEVVVSNNLGVLELRRGQRGPAHARFAEALDHLRDLGEVEGTIAAAVNVAFTEGRGGAADVAAGLRNEAWQLAEGSARWSWLAEIAAHRGLAPSAAPSEALQQRYLAGLLYARLGRAEALARMQDALLVAESATPSARRCVAEAYWKAGAPIYEAPSELAREPLLSEIDPGQVSPADLVAAFNGASAHPLHDWEPSTGRPYLGYAARPPYLALRDPKRPADVTALAGEIIVDVLETTAGSGRRRAAPARPIPYRKQAAYDRILGSLTVTPSAYVALTPAALEASLGSWRGLRARRVAHAARMLEAVERHARHLEMAHLVAHARLNRAALDWFRWRTGAAYEHLLDAQRRFARLEDARGLALTEEWLGYIMRQSDQPKRAAEHLGRARHLYRQMDDEAGAARVLSYAD